jgi:hypothetical protein
MVGTVSGPSITTDILKRAIDNENDPRIDNENDPRIDNEVIQTHFF